MRREGRTVLITGGATGIGFALAKRFWSVGSKVLVCGRREERLAAAERELSGIVTIRCDLASEVERSRLVARVISEFPEVDVVVNNAGIQNRPPPLMEEQDWTSYEREISTNLSAPIHLSMLFVQHLARKPEAALINVTSGLAFSPLSFMPTYCATKAALHSFTLSLRHQLRNTGVSVVEVIPPKVQTDLGGVGLHDDGVPLEEFADHVWRELGAGSLEFGFGFSERNRRASREDLDRVFEGLNPR
jgi:uncharacterized oxidoreductase